MTAVSNLELQVQYERYLKPLLADMPWILRITEHKDKSAPVLIAKERILQKNESETEEASLEERGLVYGESFRTILPVLRTILSSVCDHAEIPMGLERFLMRPDSDFRGNLPLDEQAGCKLALIFRLQERVPQLERVELIARRVERFTEEEAAYWHSRTTNFGEAANRWAIAGARLMLGGQTGDSAIKEMLDRLRTRF